MSDMSPSATLPLAGAKPRLELRLALLALGALALIAGLYGALGRLGGLVSEKWRALLV